MNRQMLAALSLAPLLGASQTLLQASSIALLTLVIVIVHRLALAPLRRLLQDHLTLLASLLIAAALVTCSHLALQAWALPLSLTLGIYVELIAMQCVLFEFTLGRAARWRTALGILAGFATLHVALGACRELLAGGNPTLMPGALLMLGLALALINRARDRRAEPSRKGSS